MSTLRWIIAVIAPAALAAMAVADDVVILKPKGFADAPTRMTGEVVDLTGRRLILKGAGGGERVIPAERVEGVETHRNPEHELADKLLTSRDFKGALAQYRAALAASREPRDWVRRQILAQIVWCLRSLDEPDQAGEYFLILVSRDPTTADFDAIPLEWTDEPRGPAIVEKARAWLAQKDSSPAVLMGASQLLETPRRRDALDQLEILKHDPDPRIGFLAQAQLWRASVARATFDELKQWLAATESGDPRLRAGAYFLLGTALVPRNPDEAARVLLKLPILYPRERGLSAAALLRAGGCLESLRRPRQAATLYRELADRYADTQVAAAAASRLQALAPGGQARDN